MRRLAPALLALVAADGFSWWAYPQQPSQVATHVDPKGDPNGGSLPSGAPALSPRPGVALASVAFAPPRLDRRRPD